MTTFPLEPLATAAGVTLGQIGGQTRTGDHDPRHGYQELGYRLDVSRTTLRRWRATGLTIDQADQLAGRLGMLPHEIWPGWYDACALELLPPAARVNAAKTACPQGHPYSHTDNRGKRCCRWCHTEKVRQIRANPQARQVVTAVQRELFAC